MREPLFTRRFAGLWLYAFLTFFSAFQLLPAIPFRIMEIGGSKSAAGLFLSVYTFASAFAAPVMGSIADQLGRRRMLVVASILFIVFSIGYGLIPNLHVLLAIGVIHGALWSGLMSAAAALMTEYIPATRRTEGLAYWGLASTAAIGIAPAVGLFVLRHSSWPMLCLELAGLSAVMAVWATRLPANEAPPDASLPSIRDSFDWPVIRTALSLGVISFGYGGITSYAAIYAIERHVKPESIYFTVFAATIVLVRVFTSHLGDRFGPVPVVIPAFVAMPLSFAVLSMATTKPLFIASAILFGIGLGAGYPALVTFVLSASDPQRRARTFGSIVWAFDTGIGSGSLLIGVLAERRSLSFAYGCAAAISCLAIPLFLLGARSLRGRGTPVA